ncbi:MAG TPA: deoxyguanosinetriphosphate triphosphohydrolase [Anaerolineae bacterium]|nr:deoxyguanosinetriphosphate triphosphohydrolase [Anaerolineae bacterium]HOQ99975.1 deoxyguanosinetriphosphate triphosphohydrolase [Anaerolineae bacterium]HPL29444.1 deoxyguanosinetriphosphate triphosphohydrolase [Anaerolineae bacterium]
MFATRERLEENEAQFLAPYASTSRHSRGRQHPEPEHPYRTAFQRDRDRIVHTTSFRRLEYKTQVFVNYEGDHYRTRLTHTLETAQIARTVARTLRLNEDLTEAIALAHDLGHTPFGHAGEAALHDIMREHGGFDHNAQSLRQVEQLERRYPAFPGLNLTWEVREGIVKHTTEYDAADARDYEPGRRASLEAQIVNVADEIAYNAHDIDDGLRAGLILPHELATVRVWSAACARAGVDPASLGEMDRRVVGRELINAQVTDLLDTASAALTAYGIGSPEQARAHPSNLVAFSPELSELNRELRLFLRTHLYRHYRVMRMAVKAQRLVGQLFDAYLRDPSILPDSVRARFDTHDPYRAICDYIAGMTDRFALEEHRKLFDPAERT